VDCSTGGGAASAKRPAADCVAGGNAPKSLPMTDTITEPRKAFGDWPMAVKSILAFWAVYSITIVIRAFLSGDPQTVLINKAVIVTIGIGLTFMVYAAISVVGRQAHWRQRAIVAFIASFLAAVAMSGVLMAADRYQDIPQDEKKFKSAEGYEIIDIGQSTRIERPGEEPITFTWPRVTRLDGWTQFRIAADGTVVWWFFFAAWSAFYLAMVAQARSHDLRRRASAAEAAAQAAQVRALRYQVNPHFLFNTLNSLSSLVMSGRNERAEEMLLALSTFFRTSLSLNATADVSLEEEIELQRLYLDIEKVRFPSRLKVEIDIPDELMVARLPALILQPIVENAIKYGVSRTRGKVTLRIAATRIDPGRFEIRITNDGKPDAPARQDNGAGNGTGVGLANVCQRLDARFGGRATCRYGPADDGGFEVRLILPFERTDG
jgi:two-component system, LytTR family, sensor kinase